MADRAGGLLTMAALGLLAGLAGSTAFIGGAPAGGARLRAAALVAGAAPSEGAAAAGGASALAACSAAALLTAAGLAAARRGVARRAAGAEVTANIPRPEDLLESPKFPLYLGSTGGYMSRSTKERHAITWTGKEETSFEMPTGGMALMNKGENLAYFRRKEQCIALGKQLRKLKIEDYKIYRLKSDGQVVLMHPADGVFPEKVKPGRVQVNGRPFTVAQNPQPGLLKYTKYHMRPYEADPLTTLFVKAKLMAWQDQENLFPLPQPEFTKGWKVDMSPGASL